MLNICPSRLDHLRTKKKTAPIGAQMTMSLTIFNREGINSDNVPTGRKLIENSQPHAKEVKKGEFVLLGSEKNVKDHHTLRSAICTLFNYYIFFILYLSIYCLTSC